MSTEPVAWQTAVTGLAVAILAVVVAAGVDISDALQAAILGLVAAVIVVWGVITRGKVTPVGDTPQGTDFPPR